MSINIKVLGSGCANCQKLEGNVKQAVQQLGLDATVEKVTDVAQIMSYGIMRTPGLVVDGQVKVYGRVPNLDEVKQLLQK